MKLRKSASVIVGMWTCSFNLLAANPPVSPKIEALHAYLYCFNDGSFSKDVFADKNPNLTNTIIGEGFAGKPVHSTLVTVEVSGKPSPSKKTKLEVVVTNEKNKPVLKKTTDVTMFEADSRYFFGVWLEQTGGEALKVTAKLLDQPNAKPVSRILPFALAE